MASHLTAKKKKEQKRKKPPEDFVDFHSVDEPDEPYTDSQRPSHSSRHPRRDLRQQQYSREDDDHTRIHGQSSSKRPLNYPPQEAAYEGEPRHFEGEPRRYEKEPEPLEGRTGPYKGSEETASVIIENEVVAMRNLRRYKQRPQNVQPPSVESAEVSSQSRPVRASAYSTLSVKSWSELNNEITEVLRDLDKHFKPIFDKHGPEGVRVNKLREELNSRSSQHLLGRESIAERLQMADRDGDDYLSYSDFVSMITQDLKQERKLAFRGMLLSTLGSIGVLPKEKRDNFLANYTLCPPPLFIPFITITQLIIFGVYVADMNKRGLEVSANSGYPYYSPLPYSPSKRQEVWRFLTYMFIHDGYLHIIYNVIAQLLFGFPLEIVHTWWRVSIIYLVGVAAGSLAHSVVDPAVGLVGASGGVYAILGAHLAAVVTNWKEMNYRLCDQEEFDFKPCCALSRFFFSAPARLALVVFIVVPDTGLAIVRRVALDEHLRIGVSAHVGGFLSGLFLGIPVLKNINKHAWETHLGWVTLCIFLLVCAFAIFFNSFFRERYPPTDWS